MKKKFITFILATVISVTGAIGLFSPAKVQAIQNGWTEVYENDPDVPDWVKSGQHWYYMNEYGEMQTEYCYINGKLNHFNGIGVWQG